MTDETRTPYDVAVSADQAGYASARMDLTPDEVALLGRIAERLDGGGVDAPRLTVELPRPTGGYWLNQSRVHLEPSVTRPRPQIIPVEPFPGELRP